MRKLISRIAGLSIAICFAVTIVSLTLSASAENFGIRQVESSYFNESSCLTYAQNFIKNTVFVDPNTTWTLNTKPSEIIKTYDTEGNVNAYIINLATNNSPTGYIIIEAFTAGEPNVIEYGYNGVYYLTDSRLFGNVKSEHMIYSGSREYFTESNGMYYTPENHQKVKFSKKGLEQHYLNRIEQENDYLLKTKSEKSQTVSQASKLNQAAKKNSTVNVNVPKLSSFIPEQMQDYSSGGVCEVAMGLNMLKYWNQCRGVSDIILNNSLRATFNSLKYNMKWSSDGVTEPNGFNGMQAYITNNNLRGAKGRDFRNQSNLSWAIIKSEINNGNVFEMGADVSIYQSGNSGYHSFLAVGYSDRGDGQFVRVVDEWDHSTSHYYRYVWSYISDIWYYRW